MTDDLLGWRKDKKLHGYEWYRAIGSPRYILAPMVNVSELTMRVLCRRYNCHMAYTTMLNAFPFTKVKGWPERFLSFCDEDKPLGVQFAANDPDILHTACTQVMETEKKAIEDGPLSGPVISNMCY